MISLAVATQYRRVTDTQPSFDSNDALCIYASRSKKKSARKFSCLASRLSQSLNVIGTDTNRSATYDFLLMLHSNRGPILYRFRSKRRFLSKLANFPTPRMKLSYPGTKRPNSLWRCRSTPSRLL